jgi:hypothetical protein
MLHALCKLSSFTVQFMLLPVKSTQLFLQLKEYKSFVDWLASQPHRHKIFICGNRDIFMDTHNCQKVGLCQF